jgi:hypothetical protein
MKKFYRGTLFFKNFSKENNNEIIKEFYNLYTKKKENIEDYYPIIIVKEIFCAYFSLVDMIFVVCFKNDVFQS